MTSYLIDTNIVSELSRTEPHPAVALWFDKANPVHLCASVVTLGEIRTGIESLPFGKRRTSFESWLQSGLPEWFDLNLLPITRAIADRWGRLTVQARRSGGLLKTPDGLIAATAIEHDLTLVTRNVKDFTGLGGTILNPWQPLSNNPPEESR